MNNKSSVALIVILIALGIVLVGGGIWYVSSKSSNIQSSSTSNLPISNTTTSAATSTNVSPASNETANWKTYQNEEYGFEIKYPNDWEIVGCNIGDPSPALRCFTIQKGSWEGTGYVGTVYITLLKSSAYESSKKPPSAKIVPGSFTEKNISVGSQSITEYSYIIPNVVIGWSGSDHIIATVTTYYFAILFNQKVYQVSGSAVEGTQTENDLNQIISTFKFTK